MKQPTLYLTIGLPGTGTTTAARRTEDEHRALRLTKDEWMKALYGRDNPASASDVIEGRLIQIGMRALEIGVNVVIDYGLWSRDERSALRQAAADIGAAVVIRYFELSLAEQRKRLEERQAAAPNATWPMYDQELAEWAAKIDIRRGVNSTGANLSAARRLDSRPGLSGPRCAGHHPSSWKHVAQEPHRCDVLGRRAPRRRAPAAHARLARRRLAPRAGCRRGNHANAHRGGPAQSTPVATRRRCSRGALERACRRTGGPACHRAHEHQGPALGCLPRCAGRRDEFGGRGVSMTA